MLKVGVNSGIEMHRWLTDLFPINRSITGQGVRETLSYLKNILPDLNIISVASGEKVFDWDVPEEWVINEAWIKDSEGNVVVDFSKSNLHVVNYSTAIDEKLSFSELSKHLYFIKEQPSLIPYVTSYYKKHWGFCIEYERFKKLDKSQTYHAYIDAEHIYGELNYAELVIKGKSDKEMLISSYVCHPSMANNELSGPVVLTQLAKMLSDKDNYYTYRFILVPETIGAITYLSKNLPTLKMKTIGGFVLTCIGDEGDYSYLPSRTENSMIDKVVRFYINRTSKNIKQYSWRDRGSDERQFCAPGVDLPVCSLMRTKYGEYSEYHTSGDDLSFVTPAGLYGGLKFVVDVLNIVETNFTPIVNQLCEPQLGKRNLYPNLSTKENRNLNARLILDILSISDGTKDIVDIAVDLKEDYYTVRGLVSILEENKLVRRV